MPFGKKAATGEGTLPSMPPKPGATRKKPFGAKGSPFKLGKKGKPFGKK
jgi:hypothetical protein